MEINIKELTLKSLIELKSYIPALKSYNEVTIESGDVTYLWGICSNTSIISNQCELIDDAQHQLLGELVKTWDKYSECHIFPVPSTNSLLSNSEIYHKTLNKWTGEYGQLRIELLDHMITSLQSELNSHED